MDKIRCIKGMLEVANSVNPDQTALKTISSVLTIFAI